MFVVCILAMNTSEFAESYRIQTYAEYVRAKQQRDKNPNAPVRRRPLEDGWSDVPYCSATTAMTTAAYSYTHNRYCLCIRVMFVKSVCVR